MIFILIVITHLLALFLGYFLSNFFHEMKLSKSNFTSRYALNNRTAKKKFKKLIRKNGLNQIELSKKINIDYGLLSKFINGRKTLPVKHQANICNALNISIDELKKYEQEITGKH
jgi:DNA-binding Xre family transcriptional regulator